MGRRERQRERESRSFICFFVSRSVTLTRERGEREGVERGGERGREIEGRERKGERRER